MSSDGTKLFSAAQDGNFWTAMPSCGDFTLSSCSEGYHPKDNLSSIVCATETCTNNECCEGNPTCIDFPLSSCWDSLEDTGGDSLKKNLASITCATENCTEHDCCEGCTDPDEGPSDSRGYGCDWHSYNEPSDCGLFDDDDFTATKCCACRQQEGVTYITSKNRNMMGKSDDPECTTNYGDVRGQDVSGCGRGRVRDDAIAHCTISCNAIAACIGFVTHPWGASMIIKTSNQECMVLQYQKYFDWHEKYSYAIGHRPTAAEARLPAPSPSPSSDLGVSWTESTILGTKRWSSITSSSDGTIIVAVVYGGNIWRSVDSGVSWTEDTSIGSPKDWKSITSSSDGTKLAAVVIRGNIWRSADSGLSWTEDTSVGSNELWYSITSSSDGTKLAAVVMNGDIWRSADAGVSWETSTYMYSDGGEYEESTEASFWQPWRDITSSSDGTMLAAVAAVHGREARGGGLSSDDSGIWLSEDSGVSWTADTTASYRDWKSITSSSDGTMLAAVSSGSSGGLSGSIWRSFDSGVTWMEDVFFKDRRHDRTHDMSWVDITMSPDGTQLAAVVLETSSAKPAVIWRSANSGAYWTEDTTVGRNKDWRAITLSSDGSKLAGVVYNGNIWTVDATMPMPKCSNFPRHWCQSERLTYGDERSTGGRHTRSNLRLKDNVSTITCADVSCTQDDCCEALVCKTPTDVSGYVIASEVLDLDNFAISFTGCAAGYEGRPRAHACPWYQSAPGAYRLTGCTAVVCTTPADVSGYAIASEVLDGPNFAISFTGGICAAGYSGSPVAAVCARSVNEGKKGCTPNILLWPEGSSGFTSMMPQCEPQSKAQCDSGRVHSRITPPTKICVWNSGGAYALSGCTGHTVSQQVAAKSATSDTAHGGSREEAGRTIGVVAVVAVAVVAVVAMVGVMGIKRRIRRPATVPNDIEIQKQ